MHKVFPRETVIFLREDGSIPSWPSQVVTRHFRRREKIVENMVVIAYNIREKCLVGLLTDFEHRNLRIGQKPDLTALLMIDCSRCLSEASVKPHQSGDAYENLLTSVAWVTTQRALPLSPWDLKTLRANDVWAHLLTKLSIWGLNDKWSWMATPRTTNWLTLCIPGIGGGGKLASLELGLRIIISVDFLVFNMRLLLTDQLSIAKSSFFTIRFFFKKQIILNYSNL